MTRSQPATDDDLFKDEVIDLVEEVGPLLSGHPTGVVLAAIGVCLAEAERTLSLFDRQKALAAIVGAMDQYLEKRDRFDRLPQ
jgi:hypothetical protein